MNHSVDTYLSLFFTILRQEAVIFKQFDKEYQTQYPAEVIWLTEHGIRYSFVKDINGISTYKYKKNRKLFKSLFEFYSQ